VTLLKALQQRNELDTSQVDDVVLGVVSPIGDQGADIARFAALYAGWDFDAIALQRYPEVERDYD